MNIRTYVNDKCTWSTGEIREYNFEEIEKEIKDEKIILTKLKNLKERYKEDILKDSVYLNKTESKQLDNAIKLLDKVVTFKETSLEDIKLRKEKQQRVFNRTQKEIKSEFEKLNEQEQIKYIVYFDLEHRGYKTLNEYKEAFVDKLTEWIVYQKEYKTLQEFIEDVNKRYKENTNIQLKTNKENKIAELKLKFLTA